MIVERSMSDGWLSNGYLVADAPGGHAVVIDTGGPPEPLLDAVAAHRLTVTHVLCTHRHVDHVQHNEVFRERFGCPVGAHPLEAAHIGGVDLEIEDGDEVRSGALRLRALHTPGHTAGMLAFSAPGHVFTGDTLFRGAVGGTRAPGHTDFADLKRSVMDVLMALPHDTEVHPGHTDPTTIGAEWERNPFVRVWRGLDPEGSARCTAFGEPATLLLSARDYDGGTKCWVRFDDGGRDDLVPGSRVTAAP